MTISWDPNETKNRVLTENTAQSVFKYLTDQESNRAKLQNRWIWELLQNARDAAITSGPLTTKIQYDSRELVFSHNGSGFTGEQIAHLIYHGSTKVENPDTIGQYGSGFLTTHLLSSEVVISGQISDGQDFSFPLVRKPDSVAALHESMDEAWKRFCAFQSYQQPILESFTTSFRYPIRESSAAEAVKIGIETLKQCAPYVVVFNQEFSSINIEDHGERVCFKVERRSEIPNSRMQRVTVAEITNNNRIAMEYLLVQGEKASVAAPLISQDNNFTVPPIENIPRLFLGFPLVGTEDFSFPVVINSLNFKPTENRDGVYLWQNDEDEANLNNQRVIEEACELLVDLLVYAAESGWCDVHQLAKIPPVQEKEWLNTERLRGCLKGKLIDQICEMPVFITDTGTREIQANILVFEAGSEDGIETLWDLLKNIRVGQALTKREEAVGWNHAIKSWESVDGDIRLRDAGDLARHVEKVSKYTDGPHKDLGHLKNLQERLGIDAIDWLNRLYQFLIDDGFDNEIRTCRFIPDQNGQFHKLTEIYRDTGMDEELKDIADLLGENYRSKLRDTRLTSLDQETGAGDMDNASTITRIITILKNRASQNADDSFREASVRLFSSIVNREHYDHLQDFPVFAHDDKSGNPSVISLPNNLNNTDVSLLPLAPVRAWNADLQPFADIFLPDSILAEAFFEAIPTLDRWKILNQRRLVITSILWKRKYESNFKTLSPDVYLDEQVHNLDTPVPVTFVAGFSNILKRVSDSRGRAILFWRFLTEWLTQKDPHALELKEANCQCGETHKYYSGAWVIPVRNNAWIRLDRGQRVRATDESLANLLQNSGLQLNPLNQNPAVSQFLRAIGVNELNLTLRFASGGDESEYRALEGTLAEIVSQLKQDENLLLHLEERREQRRLVHENQYFGQRVEELVRENLEKQGFSVSRTGTGSDFEISDNTDDMITLDVARDDKRWLIEVKSTRSQNVSITPTQAQTAVEKGDEFLLCVVPIGQENGEVNLETVREKMRFVKNIGPRVTPLCRNLRALEEQQDQITAETSSGVGLVITGGTTRIKVNHTVWESEGIPLETLSEHLT